MRFCEYNNCNQPVWGTDKITKKGYCKRHQFSRTDLDRRSIIQKGIAKKKAIDTKIRSLNQLDGNREMMEAKKELKEWFAMVASIIDKAPFCWNCKTQISKSDYRNSSAHILPKSLFPSVSTHRFNFIVAGNRCGCHELTHRLDTFSEMAIFPMAVKRFFEFEPFIVEHHKFLNTFKEYANEI